MFTHSSVPEALFSTYVCLLHVWCIYSTAQKKVKVPAVRFGCGMLLVRFGCARGTLEVRSRYALGTLLVRSWYAQGSLLVLSAYAVRFGSVRYFCTRCARIRPFCVNAHARYCTWLFFLDVFEDFHAVHCAVGAGLPRADSLDFTMCLGDPFFVSSLKVNRFMRLEQSAKGGYCFSTRTEPKRTCRTAPTRFACGSLLVRSWFGRGSLLVRSWFGRGSLLVRSWCAHGSLEVRYGTLTFF